MERKGKSCTLQRRFKGADRLPFFSSPFYPFFLLPSRDWLQLLVRDLILSCSFCSGLCLGQHLVTGRWEAGVGADAQCTEVAVPQVCWGAANRAGGASLAEKGFEDVCISLFCAHFWDCFSFCPFSLFLFYSLLILCGWAQVLAQRCSGDVEGRAHFFRYLPCLVAVFSMTLLPCVVEIMVQEDEYCLLLG